MTEPVPPLTIHVWYHPDSSRSRELASHIFRAFSGGPDELGPRLPVLFSRRGPGEGPPPVPSTDVRGLLLFLVDARMARGVAGDEAEAWDETLVALHDMGPPNARGFSVLPVAVDEVGLALSQRMSQISFLRLGRFAAHDQATLLTLHAAIRAIRLLSGRTASDEPEPDALPSPEVRLFLSHAKEDLPRPGDVTLGPVAALFNLSRELPINPWIDAREIDAGDTFSDEIVAGIKSSSAVVIVLGDKYSGREWCRREVLEAKAAGRPLILVDAVRSRVVRLFPYVGNAPVVRWRAAVAPSGTDLGDAHLLPHAGWEAEDARTVLEVALLESLRYLHERELLQRQRRSGEHVLGTHPEALTLLNVEDGTQSVLYPDPPLGRDELEKLDRLRTGLHLSTPLQRLAQRGADIPEALLVLSLSDAPDVDAHGGSRDHLATIVHDLSLYLLLSGYRLGYGGSLLHQDLGGHTGQGGYVRRLLELVREYSPLSMQLRGVGLQPLQNFVAWPLHKDLTAEDLNLYQRHVGLLEAVDPPPDLDVAGEFAWSAGTPHPADTPSWRYARARSLTTMREVTTHRVAARIVLGGRLTGYTGLLPGIVEEALLTLEARRPLFVLGGCGGASRLVADGLRGRPTPALTTEWCRQEVLGWEQLSAEYRRRGRDALQPEDAATRLLALAPQGPAQALSNGLDDQENEELFETTNPRRVVELVLAGLRRSDLDG